MSSTATPPLEWNVDWNNLKPMQRLLMWFPLIGPQKRIYADLLRQLRARSPQEFQQWETLGPGMRGAAERVTGILKDYLDWPKMAVFLPEDPADIPFWDRKGNMADVEAFVAVEREFSGAMPDDFWTSLPKVTFGEAIARLLEAGISSADTHF